ncbi:methionine aminopeptidase [candidate division WOR-1 bacterium DG_54_3]|uniref:Methionine aminopeptidase n=1 Tax=candidate division WOR-1 bacterium DG_54_3 TaxID=1703775 RepID=A0A0S7XUX0_UNCSA|nr:MAG: methionine aminopeptidase [candidate division WOR-1 bacterium DG_54_3]
MINLKTKEEIKIIKTNGRILAKTLELLRKNIKPEVKTKELDRLAEDFIRKQGAYPAFKGYRGFPASVCVSIDNEVVHGIPGERRLAEGQIVSVDIGVFKNNYYADAAFTFGVGEISDQAQRLLGVTQEALKKGLECIREGRFLSDISYTIQSFVEKSGFSVVRDLVGHGIGMNMHEEPQVPNFGPPGQGPILKMGMVLAIEPMVNMGSFEIQTKDDNWTIVTKDGSLSAHFEHTVAVTENGAMVLTENDKV